MKHFGANFETNSPGFFRPWVGDPPENQAKEGRKFAARPAAVAKDEADLGKSTRAPDRFLKLRHTPASGFKEKPFIPMRRKGPSDFRGTKTGPVPGLFLDRLLGESFRQPCGGVFRPNR